MSLPVKVKDIQGHEEIARRAQLKVFDYESPFMHEMIEEIEDRVLSSGDLKVSQLVCRCSPLLSYHREPNKDEGPSLLFALCLVSLETIGRLLKNLSCCYPRSEEEAMRGFEAMYNESPSFNPDDLKTLAGQPGHAIVLLCHYNHFSVGALRYLYVEASKFNHSCNPNCKWSIDNGVISITTSRNTEAGEELTISYYRDAKLHPRDMRNSLIKNAGFYCRCSECVGRCNTCNRNAVKLFNCSKCRTVQYCSRECQRNDWVYHKGLCSYLSPWANVNRNALQL